MSGRGDNNKAGSAGRGVGNQSNQGIDKASHQGKSNSNKHAQPSKRSVEQDKQQDQASNRNTSTERNS